MLKRWFDEWFLCIKKCINCDGKYFKKLWKISMYEENYGTAYVYFTCIVYLWNLYKKRVKRKWYIRRVYNGYIIDIDNFALRIIINTILSNTSRIYFIFMGDSWSQHELSSIKIWGFDLFPWSLIPLELRIFFAVGANGAHNPSNLRGC